MRIEEKRELVEFKFVTTGYKCDNCGNQITANSLPREWHQFSSYHNEWGNDSCESILYYDVCSPKCYIEKFIYAVEKDMDNVGYDGKADDKEIQFARLLAEHLKNLI